MNAKFKEFQEELEDKMHCSDKKMKSQPIYSNLYRKINNNNNNNNISK